MTKRVIVVKGLLPHNDKYIDLFEMPLDDGLTDNEISIALKHAMRELQGESRNPVNIFLRKSAVQIQPTMFASLLLVVRDHVHF